MIKIVNYAKMTLKELEAEHTKQNQILLDMIQLGKYSKNDITLQKDRVDSIYKKICERQRKISKMKGTK